MLFFSYNANLLAVKLELVEASRTRPFLSLLLVAIETFEYQSELFHEVINDSLRILHSSDKKKYLFNFSRSLLHLISLVVLKSELSLLIEASYSLMLTLSTLFSFCNKLLP